MIPCFVLTVVFSVCLSTVLCTDIVGCGGFVKSHVPVDLSQIDVRLYTNQGTLKESSDCAPTNGYYFIPLSDEGEYTLSIEAPTGWSFEPKEVRISFDGVKDPCTLSKDINFHFKGFSIYGQVTTRGFPKGPDGVKISLKTESGEGIANTVTAEEGSFQLLSVEPGKYVLTAYHPTLKFSTSSVFVSVKDGNVVLPTGALVVAGYDITGLVVASGDPVKGVTVLLYSENKKESGLPLECSPPDAPGSPEGALCQAVSDADGTFRFAAVPCGSYTLRPYYESFQVLPSEVGVRVVQSHVHLPEKFVVKGFSVKGRVLTPSGRGLGGVTIYLDKAPVTETDSDGSYSLDRMETGVYDLSAKSENYTFGVLRVKISPASPQLEPLVAAGVKFCGKVTSDAASSLPRIQIRAADPTRPLLSLAVEKSGEFCGFLEPGLYSFSVGTSEGESSVYLPVSRDFEVKDIPINNIEFSQLRGTIQGKIVRLNKNLSDPTLTVKLKGKDKLISSQPVDSADDFFVFNDVTPSVYTVEIASQLLCFEKDSHTVSINVPKVAVPDFVQTGFALRIRSSHPTEIDIKTRTKEHVKTASLARGENSVCLPANEQYVITPDGCHGYDLDEIVSEAGHDSVIDLVAVSHDFTGIVTSNDPVQVSIRVTSAGKSITTLGPLPGTKSPKGFIYEFKYRVKEGELISFSPTARATVFAPESMDYRGESDCKENGVRFSGERGILIEGKIVPPLEGVTVMLKTAASDVTQVTGKDGKFSFGPLKGSEKFELLAEKESYVLTGPDSDYAFQAHKLAQVQVTVSDSTTSVRLPGVLLSLTGGEKYRKNSLTEDDGERTFHSLSPGEYFLRPMMKEYKFDPPSVIIQLKAGETKAINLKGRRVSFSVFGVVTSLSGVPEENIPVEVLGIGDCAGNQEEGVSDNSGAFRIRGLSPNCRYTLQLKPDTKTSVYRLIPSNITVSTSHGDVEDIRLIALHAIEQADVSVFVTAQIPEHLKTLTVKLYREDNPELPIHVVRLDTLAGGVKNWGNAAAQSRFLRGGLLVSLPFLSKDGTAYFVTAESSLNPSGHTYTVPSVRFLANKPFLAVDLNFDAQLKSVEQESPRNFVASLLLGLVGIIFWQFRQGWPALGTILAWWAARQEAASDGGAARKKTRARKM